MRLSARHRGSWLNLDQCGISEIREIPGRFGTVSIAKLGQGEPIVMLPGLSGGWQLLAPLARRLAKQHEVFLIGLRGDDGHSDVLGNQRTSDHAEDIARRIEELGLERPTVFGASFGGAVALELAIASPRSVGNLILSGVEARFRANLGSAILRSTLERFPLPRDSAFLNQFFNVLHGRRPEPGPEVDFIIRRCWETDQGVVAERLRGLEGFDLTERLWEIEAPTLVLGGTKDVVIPPSRQMALAKSIPGARFVSVEGAGHVGFVTHRAEFGRSISSAVRASVASRC